MELTAFELGPDYSLDELQGATMSYGPHAYLFDIKAALTEGNGVIVTDDSLLASTLRGNPILQTCDVPSGAVPVEPPGRAEAQEPQPVLYEPQEPLAGVTASPSVAGTSVADEAPAAPETTVTDLEPEPETVDEPGEPDRNDDDEEKGWK